jgi:hypothetical protein
MIGSFRMIAAALVESPKRTVQACIHGIFETSQIDVEEQPFQIGPTVLDFDPDRCLSFSW